MTAIGTTEESLEQLQKRRVTQQLEIITTLTGAQDTALDSLCALLPLVDEPNLLHQITDADKPAALVLMKSLPLTHVITRCSEGRWPA